MGPNVWPFGRENGAISTYRLKRPKSGVPAYHSDTFYEIKYGARAAATGKTIV